LLTTLRSLAVNHTDGNSHLVVRPVKQPVPIAKPTTKKGNNMVYEFNYVSDTQVIATYEKWMETVADFTASKNWVRETKPTTDSKIQYTVDNAPQHAITTCSLGTTQEDTNGIAHPDLKRTTKIPNTEPMDRSGPFISLVDNVVLLQTTITGTGKRILTL
jgi:hypothetical protein